MRHQKNKETGNEFVFTVKHLYIPGPLVEVFWLVLEIVCSGQELILKQLLCANVHTHMHTYVHTHSVSYIVLYCLCTVVLLSFLLALFVLFFYFIAFTHAAMAKQFYSLYLYNGCNNNKRN